MIDDDAPRPITLPLIAIVAALLASYLALEWVYVHQLPMAPGEFAGAEALNRLRTGMPYRDFRPYKTLLGYYLQMPPLLAVADAQEAMIAVKLWTALLLAIALGWCAWRMARRYHPAAICVGLAMLLFHSTWLERSAALRVDALTAIVGLISLVLMLERRTAWSGAVAGLCFLVSQKGIYLAFSGGFAMVAVAISTPDGRMHFVKHLMAYLGGLTFVVGAYLGIWSWLVGWEPVWTSIFDSHYDVIFGREPHLQRYWGQTLKRNRPFYWIAGISLFALTRARHDEWSTSARTLTAYGTMLTVLCIFHRQPWPYFFVLLLPTACAVTIAGLDMAMLTMPAQRRPGAFVFLLVLCILWPLAKRAKPLYDRDPEHQREVAACLRESLAPGEPYLAGVPLAWQNPQAPRALAWLDSRKLAALERTPREGIEELLQTLRERPPKVLVECERTRQLPPRIRRWLDENYALGWANLRTYAPSFRGRLTVRIAYSGTYRVWTPGFSTATIGGRTVKRGDSIVLEAGDVEVIALAGAQLGLDNPAFRRSSRGAHELFPGVHNY